MEVTEQKHPHSFLIFQN